MFFEYANAMHNEMIFYMDWKKLIKHVAKVIFIVALPELVKVTKVWLKL